MSPPTTKIKSVFSVMKDHTFPLSRPTKPLITSPLPTPPLTPDQEHHPTPSQTVLLPETPSSMYPQMLDKKPLTLEKEWKALPPQRRIAALKRVNKMRLYLGQPERQPELNLDGDVRFPSTRLIPPPVMVELNHPNSMAEFTPRKGSCWHKSEYVRSIVRPRICSMPRDSCHSDGIEDLKDIRRCAESVQM
jgi:hypothetical protein